MALSVSKSCEGHLVNMPRKVWMICSVKATPICTRSAWNSVRKKLSISSVTSERERRQDVRTIKLNKYDYDTRRQRRCFCHKHWWKITGCKSDGLVTWLLDEVGEERQRDLDRILQTVVTDLTWFSGLSWYTVHQIPQHTQSLLDHRFAWGTHKD